MSGLKKLGGLALAFLAIGACQSLVDFKPRKFVECEATEPVCEEHGVVTCEDGRWSQPIACEGDTTCVDGACLAPPSLCSVGERRCADATPEECINGNWAAAAPCSSPVPVCEAGECRQALMALPRSGGQGHTCVVGSAGSVYCWGRNAQRQVGLPGAEKQKLPVRVPGLPSDIVEVALGWYHTCARTSGGEVWCWGGNGYGQLGIGSGGLAHAPRKVAGVPPAQAVRAAASRTCMLAQRGDVWCFGSNEAGQISTPPDDDSHGPTLVPELNGTLDLAMGSALTCAVRGDGTVMCIGAGRPAQELPLDDIVEMHMNDFHQCAIRRGNQAACWGGDFHGEVGNGPPFAEVTSPETLAIEGIDDVATGWRHTCILVDGVVSCVGYAEDGQLGNGEKPDFSAEFVDALLPGAALDISSNFGTICAKVGPRELYCWGENGDGSLGDGTVDDRSTPVRIDWDAPD